MHRHSYLIQSAQHREQNASPYEAGRPSVTCAYLRHPGSLVLESVAGDTPHPEDVYPELCTPGAIQKSIRNTLPLADMRCGMLRSCELVSLITSPSLLEVLAASSLPGYRCLRLVLISH